MTMSTQSDAAAQEVRSAAHRFVQAAALVFPVQTAVLFGSRARGSHHADSDADVAVVLTGPVQSRLRTKLALADLAYEVLLATGVHVQPHPIWQTEWEHPETAFNPGLIAEVKQDGIPV